MNMKMKVVVLMKKINLQQILLMDFQMKTFQIDYVHPFGEKKKQNKNNYKFETSSGKEVKE